ncbi:DUF397 domain-containing protein [Yinghuangia soli]|uniref:DUF397 domain-containing protein n=1 Tax=Yinghuangia soli TaxID=2908204 RepID=A0AA41PUU7_9ACTN|nr:DUF397 domain-containing protein [Yinghuangia soli]MCF2526121.1 DUF397 domain-containing protein [Yinghuangia soli]
MSTSELSWFKSSYSGSQGDSCVEVAVTEQAVHVRDSKTTAGPALTLDRADWARFVASAERGDARA